MGFLRLVVYKNESKSANVPTQCNKDPKLKNWVHTQRKRYSKKELSEDRIDRLESIGFIWNLHVKWDEMFQRLVDYKNEYNSVNVPRSYKADPKLANWVDNQRTNYKNKAISVDRIDRLESIGFVWYLCDVKWDEMFQRLVDYKNECKSADVPTRYKADPKLGQWVDKRRTQYRKKELSEDRIDRLESIGFVWNRLDAQWVEMYNRLVAYNRQHKSTDVPSNYKLDPQLGKWVQNQRNNHNNGKLSTKRSELLEFIEFS